MRWLDIATVGILCEVLEGATIVVLNRRGNSVELTHPESVTLRPGAAHVGRIGDGVTSFGAGGRVTLEVSGTDSHSLALPEGLQRYAVVVANSSGVTLHDTNDLQVELALAAHRCPDADFMECLAGHAFGGMPVVVVTEAFRELWHGKAYWELCNALPPAKPLSIQPSRIVAGKRIEILRHSPLVASISGFVSQEDCSNIMHNFAGLHELNQARVGTKGGTTSTSESRETLTNNMVVSILFGHPFTTT